MGILDAPGISARRFSQLRRRDLPGINGLPATHPAPPTITLSASGAATSVAGSVAISALRSECFRYFGCLPEADGNGYYTSNANGQSNYSGASPWSVEFQSDSPKFEILTKGSNDHLRVMVDGMYCGAVTQGPPSDGANYRVLVDWTDARAMRSYRIEMGGQFKFGGLAALTADTIIAAPYAGKRFMVLGDSFTEPTIVDSVTTIKTGHEGWVGVLAKMMGCPDVWFQGSGGTGYVNAGDGRVKFRDRLEHDIIQFDPDIVFVAGGINDASRAPTITAAMVNTEAAAIIADLKDMDAPPDIYMLAPFLGHMGTNLQPGGSADKNLQMRDALKAAADAANVSFLDIIESGRGTVTTTAGSSSGSGVSSPISIPGNTIIRVGDSDDSHTARITGISGSGPYTLTVNPNLSHTFAAGSRLEIVGPAFINGTGKQGGELGDGNSDFAISNDNTHPTVYGHENIARFIYPMFTALLDA